MASFSIDMSTLEIFEHSVLPMDEAVTSSIIPTKKVLIAEIKFFLIIKVVYLNLRAALQIYFHGIRFKTLKDATSEDVFAHKVGAKAGGPPYIGRGWGMANPYQKKLNKLLISTNNKNLALLNLPKRLVYNGII